MHKALHLAAMKEAGHVNTCEECIDRVAHYLAKSPNNTIETDEFRNACYACNVDPDSFNESDLNYLQQRLRELLS